MRTIVSLIICLYYLPLMVDTYAQKKSDFTLITVDESTIKKNNKLQYIESRPTPDYLGNVYVNSWHGVQDVTLNTPLADQIEIFGATLPDLENRRPLAIQMRMLRFSIGDSGDKKGKGLCHIRASLYDISGSDDFNFLCTIDTLVVSDMKKVREEASNAIKTYISNNWNNIPDHNNIAISLDQVYDIDVYEKEQIPFYTSHNFPNGIYKNYSALKKLKPTDSEAILNLDEKTNKVIQNVNNKDKKITEKDAYAVVINGESYINVRDRFYKVYLKNGDYRFKAQEKQSKGGFVLGLGFGGGNNNVGGGMNIGIPIGGKKEFQEMIIDHLNGDFYWGDEDK